MNALSSLHVDYDVLDSSYYPFWSCEGNNTETLSNVEKMVKDKFSKKFVVLETD